MRSDLNVSVTAGSGICRMAANAGTVQLKSLKDARLARLIDQLADGEEAAVVVPNAFSMDVCRAMQDAVDKAEFHSYRVEPRFLMTGGDALYSAAMAGELALERYFQAAVGNTWGLQEAIFPLMTPASLIRLVLDQIWPAGCALLRLDGKTCPFGLVRMLREGGGG